MDKRPADAGHAQQQDQRHCVIQGNTQLALRSSRSVPLYNTRLRVIGVCVAEVWFISAEHAVRPLVNVNVNNLLAISI